MKRKWNDYTRIKYGFTHVREKDGTQHQQCISKANLKLYEHFKNRHNGRDV